MYVPEVPLHCIERLVPLLTAVQLLAFGVWGTLWKSLRNDLGRSYAVLNEVEISLVQQVCRGPSPKSYIGEEIRLC